MSREWEIFTFLGKKLTQCCCSWSAVIICSWNKNKINELPLVTRWHVDVINDGDVAAVDSEFLQQGNHPAKHVNTQQLTRVKSSDQIMNFYFICSIKCLHIKL